MFQLVEGECGSELIMSSSSNETEEVRGELKNCSLQEMRLAVSSLSCLLPDEEEPLEVSVCGNGLVEPGEQCDCGGDQFSCDDPCCYPALLPSQERAANRSARPCSTTGRHLEMVSQHSVPPTELIPRSASQQVLKGGWLSHSLSVR